MIQKGRISLPAGIFEDLYRKYNDRSFISPDPLQFLFNYKSASDREIAGLVASSLAYGRVQQICRSVSSVLAQMGKTPSVFLKDKTLEELQREFDFFKHRFTTGRDIGQLLYGMARIREEYGSLEKCFVSGFSDGDETVLPALEKFVNTFTEVLGDRVYYLLPSPKDGSACKRLNLYLKWMVRSDNVDPGGWKHVPASKLVMPVDVHIHRISYNLGLTNRKVGNLKTALDITDSFRHISPDDPTKYDFSLTRLGMRNDDEIVEFYSRCGVKELSFSAGDTA